MIRTRQKGVFTSAIGHRTFSYFEAGGTALENSALPKDETLPMTFGSHVIKRSYQYGLNDRANGALNDLTLTGSTVLHIGYT